LATGGAEIGSPNTAEVTITDNENSHGILQFSKAEYKIEEKLGDAIITIKRIGGNEGRVLVQYVTSDGTATAGSDYTYTTNSQSWEDGDGDDKTFTVLIRDDEELEDKETFTIELFNPRGGAQIGTPDTAIVTIRDDDCKKVTGISRKECEALVALYDSTDGENWKKKTGWKTTNSPCSWYGVTCRSKHVTGLSLANNNLKGAISKNFFKLNNLKELVLSGNDLNGTNLNNFKKLKKLEILLLNNCKLSGKIPDSLMKLKKLVKLDLNDNCLKTKVSKKLKKWLDGLNPGWDESQTACFY
jgi:hypothetical protein